MQTKSQWKLGKMGSKTTACVFQAAKWQYCTRQDMDMAMSRNFQNRNWFFLIAAKNNAKRISSVKSKTKMHKIIASVEFVEKEVKWFIT